MKLNEPQLGLTSFFRVAAPYLLVTTCNPLDFASRQKRSRLGGISKSGSEWQYRSHDSPSCE